MRRVVFFRGVVGVSSSRERICAFMLTAMIVGVAGCGAADPRDAVGQKRVAILHCVVIDDDAHRAVVSMGGLSGCTATFITQQLAVTASHCLPCQAGMPAHAPCLCNSANCPVGGAERNRGQDGWTLDLTSTAGWLPLTLDASVDGQGGPQWQVDYLYFPRNTKQKSTGEQSVLDIVILHTTQRFNDLFAAPAAPIPVASRAEILTEQSASTPEAQGGHQELAIEMVGYSGVNQPLGRRRRIGYGAVRGPLDTNPSFGFFVESDTHGVCSSDSGGPALAAIGTGGALRVVGVLSRFGEPYSDCVPGVEVRGGRLRLRRVRIPR